jgi:hypothetical protein
MCASAILPVRIGSSPVCPTGPVSPRGRWRPTTSARRPAGLGSPIGGRGALRRRHPRATLHDLRRAALTHLGEDNVSLPLLMAKSRHKNLRSLQRYVRPSPEAVAALTARHDPARRRRR